MGDFADFYNKQLTLFIPDDGSMNGGRYQKGEPKEKNIDCDVQPTDHSRTYAEHGVVIESQYTVFCNVDTDIKVGMTVKYKDDEYTIIKLVDWDDYYILYLKEVR